MRNTSSPIKWPEVSLADVAFFQEGPGVRNWQFQKTGVKLLNVKNIVEGKLELSNSDRHISEEEAYGNYAHFLADLDDLVMASSGVTWGKTAWVKSEHLPLCMNTSTIRFRPHNDAVLDRNYMRIFLESTHFKRQIDRLITGSAQPNFGPSHLQKVFIVLPPLAEQQRIAAILDKADALRTKRRAALAKLDTLLQATFLHMFGDPVTNPMGWPEGRVGDLASRVNYGTSKKAGEQGKFPIIRMGNITYEGGWDFSSLKYIDFDENEQEKYLVQKGDILFNRTNSRELVGKTAVYREESPMAFAGYLVRLTTNEKADPEFVSAFMNTPQIKQYLQENCKSIVGMANINAKEFQAIKIPIPPIRLQHKYSVFVDGILKLRNSQIKSAEFQNNLFYALQQKAFSGELTNSEG